MKNGVSLLLVFRAADLDRQVKLTCMGYDTVHLGDHHGQVTLWGGTGLTLKPGDQVTLSDDAQAKVGALADYDVDLNGIAVPVRSGVAQPAGQSPSATILTTWGDPVERLDSAAASKHDQRIRAETRQLYAALGLDTAAADADLAEAEKAELPTNCSVCAAVRI